MKRRSSFLVAFVLFALFLSACASVAPAVATPTATLPAPSDTGTPLPSSTRLPSATPQPSATPTPSASPSLTPSLTSTPSPTSAFIGFQIQASEYRYDGLSIYFVIPGVTQAYRLEVNGQPYTCQVKADLPNRMYCNGPYHPAGQSVMLSFYTQDGAAPVFEVAYVVNPSMTATIDPSTLTLANCPVRGINPKCETEHRVADNGACIVSTCVDSCGYWYSVDTCHYKTPFVAPMDQTRKAQQTLTAAAKP
jgi:hypothetical protein